MFRRFGSRVTIIHKGERILRSEDPDITQELQKALEAGGMEFALGAATTRVENRGGEIALTYETKQGSKIISGSDLLVATGRKPSTDDLGLDKAGVATDARGYIKVNGRMETSMPGVCAMGAVKGGQPFTHI